MFFFPASPIAEAIARAGIRLILTRQERVAGNMADGVSRSTNGRQMGVFAVQELAGSENAFPGVSHSYTDSTPTLYLPGSPPRKKFGEHPTFMNQPHYDLVTKYSASPVTADEVPYRLRQAFQALRSGRPQPAMVDMSEDVRGGRADGAARLPAGAMGPLGGRLRGGARGGGPAAAREVAADLGGPRRPVRGSDRPSSSRWPSCSARR